ncbi:hypothetical protein [Gordonia rubripertincta]|nr:hypothetical protein [Gordonia rubripertincta]
MLRFCTDVSPADWITRRRDATDDVASGQAWKALALFGPPEFEAYARVRFRPDPDGPHQGVPREDFTQAVYAGYEHGIVARTCRALAAETRSSDDCYFAIWAGYPGVLSPLPGGPRMHIPNRDYHLYVGTLSDLKAWEQPLTHETPALLHDPPAFVWPADRAWCLASDVDPHWAGIGADTTTIRALTTRDDIDVVTADRYGRQPFYD